jgi:glycerol uptake facilitator-like aquaporin
MAQTKRKRQTKHRGNAAGVVEVRGRTGRKPTAAEKSGDPQKVQKAKAKAKSVDKRDEPPTWRAAFVKAMFATIVLLGVLLLVLKQSNSAIGVFPVILAGYTVISYYTDKFVWERRMRKKGIDPKKVPR